MINRFSRCSLWGVEVFRCVFKGKGIKKGRVIKLRNLSGQRKWLEVGSFLRGEYVAHIAGRAFLYSFQADCFMQFANAGVEGFEFLVASVGRHGLDVSFVLLRKQAVEGLEVQG